MTSPPLQFINFFIGETNVFIILQKFFFPLEFWSKNKQLHFQTKFGSNCLKNSKIIWGVGSSHQYSNQNSWRIPWEFCSQLQLHFQPEFWSKFLKNSHLNLWFFEEFWRHLLHWKFSTFPIGKNSVFWLEFWSKLLKTSKGQLILEKMSFWCHSLDQKTTKIL